VRVFVLYAAAAAGAAVLGLLVGLLIAAVVMT